MSNSGQPYQPPQQGGGGTSPLKIVLIVLGVLALGCLCCIGASVGMGYFGLTQAGKEIYEQVKDTPAVQAEFGTLEEGSVGMDIMETARIQQSNPELGDKVVAASATGDLGSGYVYVRGEGNQFELVATKKDGEELKKLE